MTEEEIWEQMVQELREKSQPQKRTNDDCREADKYMRSQQFLQGGISASYEAVTTTIVMKKIKQKRRNEKRKDSTKRILGVLYTNTHSESYRIMMKAAISKWKCHIRIGRIKNIFKKEKASSNDAFF